MKPEASADTPLATDAAQPAAGRERRAPTRSGGARRQPARVCVTVPPTPEEKLLQTARRLFCSDGIHATGIARILKESGVARRTLYERYGSKDNLLRAVFDTEARMWLRWFDEELPRRGGAPVEQVGVLFVLLEEWFSRPDFFGCIFVNAVAEHEKQSGWIRDVALRHRTLVDARLETLVRGHAGRNARRVAEKISLVIDGAIVTAMVTGDPGTARLGASVAADILGGVSR